MDIYVHIYIEMYVYIIIHICMYTYAYFNCNTHLIVDGEKDVGPTSSKS